jgi:hypothetical protein
VQHSKLCLCHTNLEYVSIELLGVLFSMILTCVGTAITSSAGTKPWSALSLSVGRSLTLVMDIGDSCLVAACFGTSSHGATEGRSSTKDPRSARDIAMSFDQRRNEGQGGQSQTIEMHCVMVQRRRRQSEDDSTVRVYQASECKGQKTGLNE